MDPLSALVVGMGQAFARQFGRTLGRYAARRTVQVAAALIWIVGFVLFLGVLVWYAVQITGGAMWISLPILPPTSLVRR